LLRGFFVTGKIRGLPQAPGVVRIKGSHMSYYSPFYQRWITRAWPKGNGRDTPRRAAARADFKDAVQKIKFSAPEMWEAAQEWARNSPYLARDVLMAASMGTLAEITMSDGTTYVSLRVTNRTVQQLLDSIGSQPGTMLVRTVDEWQALIPGTAGQVLTLRADSGLPDWADPTGGGGGGAYTVVEQQHFVDVANVDLTAMAGRSDQNIELRYDLTPSTNATTIAFQLKLNGTWKTAAGYRFYLSGYSSSSSTHIENSQTGSQANMVGVGSTWGLSNDASAGVAGRLTVLNPFSVTETKKFTIENAYTAPSGSIVTTNGGGAYTGDDATSEIEGVRLLISSGTITGGVTVYGIR
jgi:hypothetical protein